MGYTSDLFRLLDRKEFSVRYPLTFRYLESNRQALAEREKGRFAGEKWYAFGYPKSMTLFQKPKIVVPDFNNVASFTFDTAGNFYKTGYGILLNDPALTPYYVLGLLNSKLLFKYLCSIGTMLRGGYVRFWTQFIEQLPIRTIDFANLQEVAQHDKMVGLVERMLKLHEYRANAKTQSDKDLFGRQIEQTDAEIDELVFDLYGLSAEERALVRG